QVVAPWGASATASTTDTVHPLSLQRRASDLDEGATAAYTFTATLSSASQGDTVITTDQGVITIHDGETSGTLVLGGNGEDVYVGASGHTAALTTVADRECRNLLEATGGGSAT